MKKLPFDKTYIIHRCDNNEHCENIENFLLKYDLKDDVNIWYTTNKFNFHSSIDILHKEIKKSPMEIYYKITKENYVYACDKCINNMIEHYTIIKQCYLRGFNSVFIIEDHVTPSVSIKDILEKIRQIPSDYDVIRFNTENDENVDKYTLNKKRFYNSASYALNRRAMKHYIDTIDKYVFAPSDYPFVTIPDDFNEYKIKLFNTNNINGSLI